LKRSINGLLDILIKEPPRNHTEIIHALMLTRRSNGIVGLCLWRLAIVLTGFGAAIMSAEQVLTALTGIVGVIVGGGFTLLASSVTANRQERAERRKFEQAVTAELLVFLSPVIRAVSDWNGRARQSPTAALTRWPTLPRPRAYDALVSSIGLVEGWAAAAVIAFYGNVLDLNDMAAEGMQGRITLDVNVGTIAQRFRDIANNLADALDGLNRGRAFRIVGHDLTALAMPSGPTVASAERPPANLQALLRALART
jgi:hypothetical protein